MHYIKDIFEGNLTEHAHNKFVRYSRGNFVGPLMKIKFSSSGIKLFSSFHFVDELVMLAADLIGNEKVHVKGSLVWNSDLSSQLSNLGIKYSKVSKARGIFKYELDNEVNLKDFLLNLGNFNYLISFKKDDISLTCKSSFPKPNKEFASDFCKLSFPVSCSKKILEEFAFDIDSKIKIKEIVIKHEIIISDLEIPQIDDFELARRQAKRIGKLKRFISVNGGEFLIKEIDIKV